MNYLVIEGYKEAAEQFSLESGLPPTIDFESIQERMEIRHAIQSGDVDTAIELVNDVNPEVCFALCALQFVFRYDSWLWIRSLIPIPSSFSISSNNDL